MSSQLVVLGLGELGSLYASAALKLGWRVTPGTRSTTVDWLRVPQGSPILVAVGEEALGAVLASIPLPRREETILLQNELFPSSWKDALIEEPTVMIPWFSKKKGRHMELSRPTLVHGKWSALVEEMHRALSIPVEAALDARVRDLGLVSKYAFITTINTLGVVEDLTLGAWLQKDEATVRAVIEDAHRLGEALLGARVDGAVVTSQVLEAFAHLAHHPSRGRTAAARVARARAHSARLGVALPAIMRLTPG